mgnify:CR=1 FL=1
MTHVRFTVTSPNNGDGHVPVHMLVLFTPNNTGKDGQIYTHKFLPVELSPYELYVAPRAMLGHWPTQLRDAESPHVPFGHCATQEIDRLSPNVMTGVVGQLVDITHV